MTDEVETSAEKKVARKTPAKRALRDKREVAQSVSESLAVLANQKTKTINLFSAQEATPVTENAAVRAVLERKTQPMTALLFQAPDVARAVRTTQTARRTSDEINVAVEAKVAAKNSAEKDEAAAVENSAKNGNSAESPKKSRRGSRGGKRQENSLTQAGQDLQTGTPAADSEKSATEARAEKELAALENSIDAKGGAEKEGKRARRRVRTKAGADAESAVKESAKNSEKDLAPTASTPTIRRRRRRGESTSADEVTAPKGSTRLEAKRQRRKEGREAGRRRHAISESEFLARREAVHRQMLVRERDGLNQIAVLEDGILVEHYVARHTQTSMVGNVYLGRVQNVLPSMEAAFVDIGKGRNAVLYAGEVNWDAAGLEGKPGKIEDALKSGDTVLVQVTKDPIGHKGARLTGQITLAGRHLVLVPNGTMTGISRKLPEKERTRLKKILKEIVPNEHGVIVRTAAEGATEEQLNNDVQRLLKPWKEIEAKAKSSKNAPALLKGEPELAVRVVRDVFNEDFNELRVQGENAWETILEYVQELSPELADRVAKWEEKGDIFAQYRVDEQLQKAFDRKVYLPSGGSLVIDRTEAMTVIDVNTGKFTGSNGGTLEETVTKNNLEAAEEIVRQLRLRDIGGIVVIDFIDMVLEANRDLVLRRLIECLGRDRTRHQVAEVTSLGLVQMTRKRVGQGLVEAFSTTCAECEGRGYISHDHPVEKDEILAAAEAKPVNKRRTEKVKAQPLDAAVEEKHEQVKAALANIAAAASHKHDAAQNKAAVAHAETAHAQIAQDDPVKDEPVEETESSVQTPKAATAVVENARATNADAVRETEHLADLATAEKAEKAEKTEKAVTAAAAVTEKKVARKAVKRRRVTSTGTITPASTNSFAVMSFPVAAKNPSDSGQNA